MGTVVVESDTNAWMNTTKETRRCVVLFRLGASCAKQILTCPFFLVDNHDAYKCKKGDAFQTKCAGGKPARFCKTIGPRTNYPVICNGPLKATYTASGGQAYPNKGVKCNVQCIKPAS